MFDKSAKANWALGWHQDRTICVRERHEMPGFGPWTMKSGQHHVAPPAESLAQMVTMRIHLDDIGMDNAPLLIAPRSHVLGSVAETDIPNLVQKLGTYPCLAKAGDVWIYRTLILHASDRAINPTRRRVLQVDFAAFDLPSGLEWSGI
jgi:ectoine hydroxylase-related dioxygenase (phytanoyl-CoA dioxygenase family)